MHGIYGLNGKVIATVTDNGSNFVKAFVTFSLPDSTSTLSDTSPLVTTENDLNLDEEEATFENICDSLTLEQGREDDLTQVQYKLPPHQRCAAHTLN